MDIHPSTVPASSRSERQPLATSTPLARGRKRVSSRLSKSSILRELCECEIGDSFTEISSGESDEDLSDIECDESPRERHIFSYNTDDESEVSEDECYDDNKENQQFHVSTEWGVCFPQVILNQLSMSNPAHMKGMQH